MFDLVSLHVLTLFGDLMSLEGGEFWDANPNYFEEPPVFGEDRSFADLLGRTVRGALPLIAYGAIGTWVEQNVAYAQGQIPLLGGFTLDTPWARPIEFYDAGEVGQSQDFQLSAFLAGQRVIGPIRTHTTGLIDHGVRHGEFFAPFAEDLVHPGRVELLARERGFQQEPLLKHNVRDSASDYRSDDNLSPATSSTSSAWDPVYVPLAFIGRRPSRKVKGDLVPCWSF